MGKGNDMASDEQKELQRIFDAVFHPKPTFMDRLSHGVDVAGPILMLIITLFVMGTVVFVLFGDLLLYVFVPVFVAFGVIALLVALFVPDHWVRK